MMARYEDMLHARCMHCGYRIVYDAGRRWWLVVMRRTQPRPWWVKRVCEDSPNDRHHPQPSALNRWLVWLGWL